MIRLPRRSVTRFFIPLIDVLLLLFCIFLLMPLVKGGNDASPEDTEPAPRLRQLEEEVERLRRQLRTTPPELRAELEKLRQDKIRTLQEKLDIHVLEIDAATGKLFYRDPERIEISSQAQAAEMIDQDRARRPQAEIYYLILYPRDPASPYPLREQREQYERWFADVAHGWDTLEGVAKRVKP